MNQVTISFDPEDPVSVLKAMDLMEKWASLLKVEPTIEVPEQEAIWRNILTMKVAEIFNQIYVRFWGKPFHLKDIAELTNSTEDKIHSWIASFGRALKCQGVVAFNKKKVSGQTVEYTIKPEVIEILQKVLYGDPAKLP
jgi:hypothetical protein